MPCPAQDITDTELSILQVLWETGPTTTRAITDKLYPGGAASHYATVQSLLLRLEEKEMVARSREERPQVFSARVERGEVIARRLQALAEKLCDGSMSPLLTHLVRAEKLTAREMEELRALLTNVEKEGTKPRRRR